MATVTGATAILCGVVAGVIVAKGITPVLSMSLYRSCVWSCLLFKRSNSIVFLNESIKVLECTSSAGSGRVRRLPLTVYRKRLPYFRFCRVTLPLDDLLRGWGCCVVFCIVVLILGECGPYPFGEKHVLQKRDL